MDDKIVKNYYLEKNFFLENYNELTNATIASLYQNYLFLRIMPFCNFDNQKDEEDEEDGEDGDDEEFKKTYKYLLEMNAVLQGELLTYLCIFMALKNLNKEFTKAILEKAVTSVDPDLTQLVQVIKDTLNSNNGDDLANMSGGAPVGSLTSKAIILLLLLANVSIQTRGHDADFNPYDLVAEVRNEDEFHGPDPDVKTFTMKEPVEQEPVKSAPTVNANSFGSQVSLFGTPPPITELPQSFKLEQEQKLKKEKKKMIEESPIMGQVNALMLRPKTKEEIIEEFTDAVYDLKQEFALIYDDTSKNCKKLIMATKRVGYLNPTKFQPSNSTDAANIQDDEDDEKNETSSFNDIINYTNSYLNPYSYFYTSTPPKDTNINDTTSANDTSSDNNINIVNEENSKTYGLAAINIENTRKLSLYNAQENIEQEAVYYCETLFKPEMIIKPSFENLVIHKGITGFFLLEKNAENAADIQNNIVTPFDKFVPNLIAIKEKIKTDLKSGKYVTTGKKYAKLQDISEKVEILLEIIENSKNAAFYFGNEAQFNNKMSELEEAKQQIVGLNDLFQQDNPVTFREGVLEKQREATALKQKSAQEQVIHEGELDVGKEEFERREENLDLAKNVTKIAQAEAKNAVHGTFGVATKAMEQVFDDAGDAAAKAAEQVAKTTNVLIGPAMQILGVVGGAVGIYVVYMCLNGASILSPVTRIFTGKTKATTPTTAAQQGQVAAPAAQQGQVAATAVTSAQQGQVAVTAVTAAQQGQEQMLVVNFGPNNGVVTRVDIEQNNQFAGFWGAYYEDPDTAVRLENIKRYYENRRDNNYVILYNEPPRYNLCGIYAGVLNNNVQIQLPDGNTILKAYNSILDPVLNDYYAGVHQARVTRCMEAFNMNPTVTPVVAVAQGNNVAAAQGNDNDSVPTVSQQVVDDGDDDDDNSSIASEASTVSQDVDDEELPRGGKTKRNRKNRRKHKSVKKHKKRKNKTIKKFRKNRQKTYRKK
jgi:hypothetical protein